MARSIEKIKFGLKLKTQSHADVLTLKIGNKKFTLPFEVRVLQSSDHLFVHVPPAAEIFKVTKDGLEQVSKADEAEKAVASFRQARKARKAQRVELPDNLKQALKTIPPGYKIGYDADGNMKLVKQRAKRKKASSAKKASKPAAKKKSGTARRKK